MKYAFLVLAALLAFQHPAMGDVYTVRINAATTNIPTAYGQGSNSLVLQGIRNIRSIFIDNRTAGEIAVNCSSTAGITPTATLQDIYVNATNAWAIDNAYLGNACYIRSNTGSAIATAVVVITVIGG